MGYAPDAILQCFNTVNAAMPQAINAGIYGNKPGYHNCRANLPSSDYSVQKSYDKEGDPQAGAAIDITFYDPPDMKAITRRLIDETDAHGDTGKLRGLRSFFGTVDGVNVTGRDVPGRYAVTSDPSHLWHIHLSGKRKYANDHAAWQDVAGVILGETGDWSDMATQAEVQAACEAAIAKFLHSGLDGKQYSFDTLVKMRVDQYMKGFDSKPHGVSTLMAEQFNARGMPAV
jgi:hypothetical protein